MIAPCFLIRRYAAATGVAPVTVQTAVILIIYCITTVFTGYNGLIALNFLAVFAIATPLCLWNEHPKRKLAKQR